MTRPGPKPNFFIVGAVKCGTTAMHRFLAGHPDICMSRRKEANYLAFMDDLTFGRKDAPPLSADLDQYLSLFAQHKEEKRIGDASPLLLNSKKAAKAIHAFNPDAKILIMIRNPVDLVASMHAMFRMLRPGEFPPLEEFWASESKRTVKSWNDIEVFELQQYRRLIRRLHEGLSEFQNQFGKKNVLVITQEDLRSNPEDTFRKVLRFLHVDDRYRPTSFGNHNVGQGSGGGLLHRAVSSMRGFMRKRLENSPRLYAWARGVYRDVLLRLFTGAGPREDLSPDMRAILTDYFSKDVKTLEALTGRDFSVWRDFKPKAHHSETAG